MNKAITAAPTAGADPNDALPNPNSREEFTVFVRTLAEQFRRAPEQWENRDLSAYLEAMAAWVEDMDGYYQNRGEAVPEQPTWKTLGQILLAAKVYE